jgi:hypothetical protein
MQQAYMAVHQALPPGSVALGLSWRSKGGQLLMKKIFHKKGVYIFYQTIKYKDWKDKTCKVKTNN